jgi:hypothetical protein
MGSKSIAFNLDLFRSSPSPVYDPASYPLEELNQDLLARIRKSLVAGTFPLFYNQRTYLPKGKLWQIHSCESLDPEALSDYEGYLTFLEFRNQSLRDTSILKGPTNDESYFLEGYLDTQIKYSRQAKKVIGGITYIAEETVSTEHKATLKFFCWLYSLRDTPILSRGGPMINGSY